jgi:transcriptional regulator with XRE-family HTH domain
MRGAGDGWSVGERIAFFRRRRGLTQRELAGLVGRSEEWVSSVERGRRQVRRLDRLITVAGALRVELPDLLGQPVLMEDEAGEDNVPAVRDALMTPRRLSRLLYESDGAGRPMGVAGAGRYVEQVWAEYQAGRLGRVISALPGLVGAAQRLEDDPGDSGRGWAVSARTHHLATTALIKIGENDLAWIAAERAMSAAEQTDDPLVLASAARAGTHAFLANGRYEDALSLGRTAASWLRRRMREDDPAALSLFGMLHLRTAVAAARHQDRAGSRDLLSQAAQAAQRLGADGNWWQTGFGPTNVMLHRLSAALDLGDVSYVVEHAPGVATGHLPVERAASHQIDTGRAMSLVAHDDEALEWFLDAEQAAPHLVRHSPVVRESVKAMYRRSPVAAGRRSSALAGLAERCRAVS